MRDATTITARTKPNLSIVLLRRERGHRSAGGVSLTARAGADLAARKRGRDAAPFVPVTPGRTTRDRVGGYIMPPMSPMPPGGIAGIADLLSGFSATIASLVISRPATEAA